ncbi:TKL protein kinase [Saprolegnia diclina VS20]|uniref:TKL protein kinase n=1 Tax=Saprolegnia diclina (strain VS20) TaxID=1156394 RepID=T0RHM4_SAPDV|nr:TKL protein kinase [Saprolegnia diclina VS20]EQC29312.1 TKL protein kinase [Saprolegnia diclina VS20]|eukprot:XP_008617286.1 TKL protein kinase [Saprolegnia diclina VS20]
MTFDGLEVALVVVEAMDLAPLPSTAGYYFALTYLDATYRSLPDYGGGTSPSWHHVVTFDVLDAAAPMHLCVYGTSAGTDDDDVLVGSLRIELSPPLTLQGWRRLKPSGGQVHLELAYHRRAVPCIASDELAILTDIGAGAYGVVQKGLLDGQPCAIKTLHIVDADAFTREMLSLFVLESPQLATVLAVADANSHRPKIVVEFFEAGALASWLHESPAWHETEALQIAADVAQGLAYLHARGCVHGALHPSNIMLTPQRRAKLVDLHLASATMVHSDTLLSFPWMFTAPEVLAGDVPSAASDVYSLGALLLALANNNDAPYDAPPGNPFPTIANVIAGNLAPRPMPLTAPGVFQECAPRCMAHTAEARPAAKDVAMQLETALPAPIVEQSALYLKDDVDEALTIETQYYNPEPDVEVPIFDGAELLERSRLGAGPYGFVDAATVHGTRVAVQTFLDHRDEFDHCVLLLSKLTHVPTIVQLLGVVDVASSRPQLVLEYMDGGALRTYLDSRRRFRTRVELDTLTIAHAIASALAALHAQGIVHRYVSSLSVLWSSARVAKLGNFVLAKSTSQDMVLTQGVGAMFWMAPEVIRGEYYDVSADMYSFGVLLTELDTLLPPYGYLRQNHFVTMDQVSKGLLRPELSASCAPWYRDLALACMAQDPSQRPTAAQVCTLLEPKLSTPTRLKSGQVRSALKPLVSFSLPTVLKTRFSSKRANRNSQHT